MSFSDVAFRTVLLGMSLGTVTGCGGMVSKGDAPAGTGSGSTAAASTHPYGQQQPTSSQGPATGITAAGTTVGTGTIAIETTTTWARSPTVSTSTALQYSQNAPIASDGGSSDVTCYGAIDGTSCSVSDINFAPNGPIHSVTCSPRTGLCLCQVTHLTQGGPSLTTDTASFPFTSGLCPSGSFGTVAWTTSLAALPAAVCSDDAAKLFALCGW